MTPYEWWTAVVQTLGLGGLAWYVLETRHVWPFEELVGSFACAVLFRYGTNFVSNPDQLLCLTAGYRPVHAEKRQVLATGGGRAVRLHDQDSGGQDHRIDQGFWPDQPGKAGQGKMLRHNGGVTEITGQPGEGVNQNERG